MELVELRAAFERLGIRRVKVGGFDVDGVLRGKYVMPEKFWSAAESSFGFCDVIFGWDIGDVLLDNTRVTGWHTGYPDAHARIDLSTFRVIPWEPDTAAFLVDFVNHDGSPHPACPRSQLKRVIERFDPHGLPPDVRRGVRVLPLPRDTADAPPKGISRARVAVARDVRLLVGARGAEQRPLPRDPRRDGGVRDPD